MVVSKREIMTYSAYIAKITNVRKHPNADRLLLGECLGSQVVVGINTKENDIGIYFPADGRLSDEFMKRNNLVRKLDAEGKNVGGMFDANGKVRVQKLRGEKSDGFFCPVEFLNYIGFDTSDLKVGFAFSEVAGHKICEKFITTRTFAARDKKPREKSKFPLFHEMPDTEQLAYKLDELIDGMFLVFTEKIHGTSQRSANSIEEKMPWYGRIINGIFKRTVIRPKREYKYVCGTRRVVLKDFETHSGYYGENEMFRKYAHERFVGKLHEGENVYYEVVGYACENTTIMPTCDNIKLKDKEFVKKYGKTTTFTYGCPPGAHEVYVYRMSMTNNEGVEIDYSWDHVMRRCNQMDIKHVPELSRLIFREAFREKFLSICDKFVDGESMLTPTHIREGVVVRADGSKWNAWKYKSFAFKCLENIIKLDDTVVDIEEAQGV
jgi:hypothetical protein